jgi:hypothetical protein
MVPLLLPGSRMAGAKRAATRQNMHRDKIDVSTFCQTVSEFSPDAF